MKDGFLRVSGATPDIKVADCRHNAEQIVDLIKQAANMEVSLIVFPELSITAYTCGDLFLQQKLLEEAENALYYISDNTGNLDIISVVGLPIKDGAALYNCGAVIYHGIILGLVPKQNIPNYSEFYELRHFTPGPEFKNIKMKRSEVPLGWDILFTCRDLPDFKLGVEMCEDLWVPNPPSSYLATQGATVIANLSASDEIIGKADYRRSLVSSQSAKLISAYIYADAGQGESTTDMVFSGHNLIAENGTILSQSPLFSTGITTADIDLGRLSSERRRTNTFPKNGEVKNVVEFDMPIHDLSLKRVFFQNPFVPSGEKDLKERCEEIISLQFTGLATRLRHIRAKTVVIGLSGGLDSTLALIIAIHAFDSLKLDRKGIIAVTMPCFGTTSRTKGNAEELANAYGVTFKVIPISKAVMQHFSDIGQDSEINDVTYENSQARERTQVLMDLANKENGIVIGTGDLSELALGWATYNGDHMSMYGVNSSVPKTLVRHLTAYEASHSEESLKLVLLDILDTPVSPELLPPKNGEISQKTEDLVGPYELHDFFLYYFLRFGYPPRKIYRIAYLSYEGKYSKETIKKWLYTFIKRFFAQQFKRSCLPDGPKVGSVTLSPRGDFRMPSDASAELWLSEVEGL